MAILWRLMRKSLSKQRGRATLTIVAIMTASMLLSAAAALAYSYLKWEQFNAITTRGDYHATLKYENATNAVDWPEQREMLVNLKKQAGVSVGISAFGGFLQVSETPPEDYQKLSEEERRYMPDHRYIRLTSCDSGALDMLKFDVVEGRLPSAVGEIALNVPAQSWAPALGDTITAPLGSIMIIYDDNEPFEQFYTGWSEESAFVKKGEATLKVVGYLRPRYESYDLSFMSGVVLMDKSQQIATPELLVYVKSLKNSGIVATIQRALDACDGKADGKLLGGAVFTQFSRGEAVYDSRRVDVGRKYDDGSIDYAYKAIVELDYHGSLTAAAGEIAPDSWNNPTAKDMLFQGSLGLLAIILASLIVIYNSLGISVMERAAQIGLMRALGATPLQIRRHVMMEALYIAMIGVPLGAALGIAAVFLGRLVMDAFGLPVKDFTLYLNPIWQLAALALSMVTVMVAVMVPARRAARISPVDAMRGTSHIRREKLKRRGGGLFAIFGQMAVLARKNVRRMPGRFRVTMIALTMAMVLICFGLIRGGEMINGLRDSNPYTVSINARFSAEGMDDKALDEIAAIEGVGHIYPWYDSSIVIDTPKDAVTQAVWDSTASGKSGNQIISMLIGADRATLRSLARIVVIPDDDLKKFQPYLEEGTLDPEALAAQRGIILFSHMRIYPSQIEVDEGIRIIDLDDQSQFKKVNTLRAGDTFSALLRDEQYMQRMSNLGDMAQIQGNLTPMGKLSVGAVVRRHWQYDESLGDTPFMLLMTKQVFRTLFPDMPTQYVDVYAQPGHELSVIEKIKAMTDERPNLSFHNYYEYRKQQLGEATLAIVIVGVFMAMLVLISFTSIINTMAAGLMMRRREFAMMTACGMSDAQRRKLVRFEGRYYALWAVCLGGLIVTAASLGSRFYDMWLFHYVRMYAINMPLILGSVAGAGAVMLLLTRLAIHSPLKELRRMDLVQVMRTDE